MSRIIAPQELCTAGLFVVRKVVRTILKNVVRSPESALEEQWSVRRRKMALRVDLDAEDNFFMYLGDYRHQRFSDIRRLGEECIDDPNLDLTGEARDCALVDALDGTDLLERGLFNWCAAAIFFRPTAERGKRILGSFVGLPTVSSNPKESDKLSVDVYYATADEEEAYVKRGSKKPVRVEGCSRITRLRDASICFYGQKISSLYGMRNNSLLSYIATLDQKAKKRKQEKEDRGKQIEAEDDIKFRIYTLAGIPMMLKLVDHNVKVAKTIDVVFDIRGQKPHDVVPGAYIARKAGAVLRKVTKQENEPYALADLSYEDMEDALLRPAQGSLRYVIASTEELANEVAKSL